MARRQLEKPASLSTTRHLLLSSLKKERGGRTPTDADPTAALAHGARSAERARLSAFHRGSHLRELFHPKGSASGQASCWGGRPPTASLCQNETVEASQTREPSVDKIIRI